MNVLITGANGFVGSFIVEALLKCGHSVLACARSPANLPRSPKVQYIQADFTGNCAIEAWLELLKGVDAVVNCAGILREPRRGDFERVHFDSPKALAEACVLAGVAKFVQVSALGSEQDGGFITSKHRFDEWLIGSDLVATVIRPSVVVSLRGSYGGTSLLRAQAAVPGLLFLPGEGNQKLQPVLAEDLADLVVRCLSPGVAPGEILYAAGPLPMTLREYLLSLRAWLKLAPARVVRVPLPLVRAVAAVAERFGRGPLGDTIEGMLERGNVAPPGALERVAATTGWRPGSVADAFATSASFVQHRWHARLYLLAPILWVVLVLLWLGSGLAGFLAAPPQWQAVLDPLSVPAHLQQPLVLAASLFDIALGIALLLLWRVRLVLWLMLAGVAAYTLTLGVLVPTLWLDPLGGLLKNLPILTLIAVTLVVEEGR